eukprot:3941724-Rhodomonas_salina.3
MAAGIQPVDHRTIAIAIVGTTTREVMEGHSTRMSDGGRVLSDGLRLPARLRARPGAPQTQIQEPTFSVHIVPGNAVSCIRVLQCGACAPASRRMRFTFSLASTPVKAIDSETEQC